MRLSTFLVIVPISIVLAILVALGTWQVQRLYWKEALIARVEQYLAADPAPIAAILEDTRTLQETIDYRPVIIEGIFVPEPGFLEFTTFKGQSGWNVFNLLDTGMNGGDSLQRYVLINRGYIPFEAKSGWQQVAPLPVGRTQIKGLLRVAPTEKPGSFLPDNIPAENTYYWRDLASMATSASLDPANVALWYVDEGFPGSIPPEGGSYPISGTTIISFSNNHLQYAVTWYGLALALLGVGGYFLYARRNTEAG